MTTAEAAQAVGREIEAGERLLWTGLPRQGLFLRASDALLIPFSIFWGGFMIVWEVGVLRSKAPIWFALWGVPFVLVGLYLMVGRFFVDAAIRARTAYGLTDQRVIVVSGLRLRNVKSLNLRTLSDVTLIESRGGVGTILLGPRPPWSAWMDGGAWPGSAAVSAPVFDQIDDARQVYAALRSAQAAT